MDQIKSYKDLLVWQKSFKLVLDIYRITSGFPSSEQWGLVSQMRRAVVSIPSNIAEGFGRQSTGEYRHHLSISRGSVLELETQLLLAEKLGFAKNEDISLMLSDIDEISRMLVSILSKMKRA